MVNLEAPSEPQRKISRQSKWDVGTVQWNRHRSEAHLFAASVSSAGWGSEGVPGNRSI